MNKKDIMELENIIRKSCEESNLNFDNITEKDFEYIIKKGKIYTQILNIYNNVEKIIIVEFR